MISSTFEEYIKLENGILNIPDKIGCELGNEPKLYYGVDSIVYDGPTKLINKYNSVVKLRDLLKVIGLGPGKEVWINKYACAKETKKGELIVNGITFAREDYEIIKNVIKSIWE